MEKQEGGEGGGERGGGGLSLLNHGSVTGLLYGEWDGKGTPTP